jgi:aminoglycoside phosphotransferase (APT) family kinase protein
LVIPDAKNAAVKRALQRTFGVTDFEDAQMLTAGLTSALVLRIVVRGCPYLLRIITSSQAMHDPTRQFACMKSAAEVGIAPRLWYTSVEDRIAITDFVEARPFSVTQALVRLPDTLRALHALPPFPRLVNYLDFVDGFVRKFQAANILPGNETEQPLRLYARLASVYPRHDSEWVSCHNDLKPENILSDGDRVWLVDWEAAFLNDGYLDLAMVANFVVGNDAEEESYLRAYFGEPAGEYRRARFYLMRLIVNMAYAATFLLLGSSGKAIEPDAKAPDFRDFHNRIWAGEVRLAAAESKVQYGRTHMEQFSQETRKTRFQDALRIVSDFHGRA